MVQTLGFAARLKGNMTEVSKRHTVLVVDDDKIICDLICSALGRFGFHTLAVPNGLKLVRYLKINKPDLLLLDVSMSWINGYQLADCLYQRSRCT